MDPELAAAVGCADIARTGSWRSPNIWPRLAEDNTPESLASYNDVSNWWNSSKSSGTFGGANLYIT